MNSLNSNILEPRMVDLGSVVLDLNNLDMAALEGSGKNWYTMLYMKNGNKYKASINTIVQLKPFCVQSEMSDKTTLLDIVKKYG